MLIPKVIRKAFDDDTFWSIVKEIEKMKSGQDPKVEKDDKEFIRLYRHNNELFKTIHEKLTPRMSDIIGVNLKPSYNFTSMYFTGQGFCPLHTDRPQCKYTFDLCVNQKEVWPINIAGMDYHLEMGDAVVYSGTDHYHSRKKIQEDNFCDLVFFHFVPVDFEGNLD